MCAVLGWIAAAYRRLLLATAPRRLAVQFCAQASVAVLILAILVPPFAGSDEFNHFDRADEIAGGELVATRYGGPRTSGGVVDAGINRVAAMTGSVRFHPERKVTRPMIEAGNAEPWGERVPTTFANTASYAPFLYAPAVMGIWVGQALNFSVARTLVVSRALGGLVCVGLASVAIALAGEAAIFLFVALSLPMAVFQFQTVSQDGLMVSLAALAMALVGRMRGAGARRWCLAGLTVCLALLAIGRPAYAVFCVLPLLPQGVSWRWRVVCAFCVVTPVAAWMVLTARVTFFNAEDFRGVDAGLQMAGLMVHPRLWWVLVRSVVTGAQGMEGQSFYREMVGVLGWLDVVLPGWFYGFAGVVLGAAMVAGLAGERAVLPGWGRGMVFVAGVAAVGLVFLLEYLSWTPVGSPVVLGVQGRYFLPILMFVPAMLPVVRGRWFALVCGPMRLAVLGFPAVSVAVLVSSVVRRYYL